MNSRTPTVLHKRSACPETVASEEIPSYIKQGSKAYTRAGIALFLAGFASFSLIYCVQPLLPDFANSFGISPTQSSLALSVTTGFLSFAIVLAGAFSQAMGRRGLMFCSMALAALLNCVVAVLPEWHDVLLARSLEGLVLGGVPAVAMAWLAEEIDPKDLGKAMGLYVGGVAFGAMMGRVSMGLLTEIASWRVAMGVLGALCLLSAIGFLLLLPASRHFVRKPGLNLNYHLQSWKMHLQDLKLIKLYVIGFMLISIFVTLFNYSTFRLTAEPYGFNQTQVSFIFLAFAFGIVSSSMAGSLADRYGRTPLLIAAFMLMLAGALLTLMTPIIGIICGVALVTTGFFVGHSVASSAVGAAAKSAKGHASSLYLLFYYLGSSISGSVGGWFWQHGGWSAVVTFTASYAVAGLLLIYAGIWREKHAAHSQVL
ncbi:MULTISPECIES: MFS transporter [Shewanella]|uniref:MFS transporter n=1 Tax=Shewanella TaxID=22 RepID=UPI00167991E8|nr:MFS transporter [Shewanella fodinae]MCL2905845.1 MFS transporter [Shewanella fodinae]GGY96609.1 MFS transporter [Shewanella fodinae]